MQTSDRFEGTAAMAADRAWLEIELDAEPVAGSVHAPACRAARFEGWLGLITVVETARRARVRGATDRAAGSGG